MKTLESLVQRFVEGHPQDAGKAVEELDVAEAAKIIAKLPLRLSSLLLERFAPQKAAPILETLDPVRTKEMLETVSPKQAAFVLQYLDMGKREEVLGALSDSRARQLRQLMRYPEDIAGGMMEPRVGSIPSDLDVQSVIARLRKAPRHTLYYLYVTDREGKLAGVLNMRNLLLASPKDSIKSLMSREVLSVPVTMDRQDILTLSPAPFSCFTSCG